MYGKAQSFNAASTEFIGVPAVIGSGAMTYSALAKGVLIGSVGMVVIDTRASGCSGSGQVIYFDTSGFMEVFMSPSTTVAGSVDLRGAWHHLTLVESRDGDSILRAYVDGVSVGTAAIGPGAPLGSFIGKACDSSAPWNGLLQDVRTSQVGRSDDWIKLDAYQSLNAAAVVSMSGGSATITARHKVINR
jgi:hypothetical protein